MIGMKSSVLAIVALTLVAAVGCVKTVNDRRTGAVPLVKDKFEGRYERPVDQVYKASVDVMTEMGTVARETIISPGTNQFRAIEGKVNNRHIWVRVQSVDPKVTAVTVQARTSAGGTDLPLTHEIEKQIAIKLTQ
jgi:hypothetical protein